MDCSYVLHIHLLHTIPRTLYLTHPHVKGDVIWKGEELLRVHAYYQWEVLIKGGMKLVSQKSQARKTSLIFYTP